MEAKGTTLPLAFLAAVSMWAVGYLGRFPGVGASPRVLGIAFMLLYLAFGYLAGRVNGRGFWPGAKVGFLTSAVNLLILGSLLAEGGVSPWVFVPGALLSGGVLAGLGSFLARGKQLSVDGAELFARTAVAATFLLVVAGGLVTSQGAGLAVPDWPNTYGSNMFFFPLSRMTGGVYYEHAHRLFGSLVGLTVLALAAYLSWLRKPRGTVRWAWVLVLLVVVQGVLGGLRVTGKLTLSQDPAALEPSLGLAVVHGVLGQLVLAGLVALAVGLAANRRGSDEGSLLWPRWLWGLLLLQLVLGALQRHFAQGLLVHISLATVVLLMAALGAARLLGSSPLRTWARALLVVVGLQVVLGFAALWVRGYPPGARAQTPLEVLLTTAHQAGGALLLSLATALAVRTWPRVLGLFGVRR
ncbi:hypothetical protein EG19_02695 [Thermoanaerobaculum aquaticum]|uniref:Cytochrome oxidase assembly protein n=1 Tax=Thermoanaerobaculum aquaticum TaxID=1312852 RepID=A0A062Y0M7_9BACT|nr:COX15/CtaA family protein [Thermoanaerobaculum aquaticum]KDA53901.1 hypothetical protein EG19_02695 [Thermoanaerobaculum aquaticum]